MSKNYNSMLREYTRDFLRHNFTTAVGIAPMRAGESPFDLHHSLVERQHVVRLDAWSPQSDEQPLLGYWVPQGGSCSVPRNPGHRGFVFTADFSGCSILVDQMGVDEYRVYHVQGGAGYLESEYLDQPDHGLGLAAAMTFDDYGDAAHPRGFAFLKNEGGRWWIYYQRQNGVGLRYAAGEYTAMGPQTIRGGARVPVADLTREVPRQNAKHSGRDLPQGRNVPTQTTMLPNDELW